MFDLSPDTVNVDRYDPYKSLLEYSILFKSVK